jgi:hypothetical protein
MLPEFIVIKTRCSLENRETLSFSQRKLLNLLDIEISNKNPLVHCSINCGYGEYIFKFDNGVFDVTHSTLSREELFEKISSFRDAFKNLECDLQETNFLQEEISQNNRLERESRGNFINRYKYKKAL